MRSDLSMYVLEKYFSGSCVCENIDCVIRLVVAHLPKATALLFCYRIIQLLDFKEAKPNSRFRNKRIT